MVLLTLDQMRQNMRRSHATLFVAFRELIGILSSAGYEEQLVLDEMNLLLDRGLIIADHQRKAICTADDRLRISPSGHVHIRLLGDLVYVGACAEDAFLESDHAVNRISYRLRRGNGTSQNYLPTLVLNGADLWSAIESSIDAFTNYCKTFHEGPIRDVITKLHAVRNTWRKGRHTFETTERPWSDLGTNYARDVFARAYVASVKPAGADVRLPGKYRAWIPKSMFAASVFSQLKRGDLIECRVLKWDDRLESFLLYCEETG